LGYREKGPPKLTLFQRRRRQGAVITLELEEHWVEQKGVMFFFTPCGRLVVPMFFFEEARFALSNRLICPCCRRERRQNGVKITQRLFLVR